MLTNKTYLLYAIAILFGSLILSYFSSLLYYLMAGYDLKEALPWSIWHYFHYAHIPEISSRLIASFGGPILLLFFALSKLTSHQKPDFGEARWANNSDLKKAGLLNKDGLILGKYKNKYLMNDDNTHILCVAPTRSGKGVGIVIPNLLNWSDSVICLDIKHENYNKTAGFRKAHGHDVFMWSPLDMNSHCYNPLDALNSNPYKKIGDLKIIGKILVQDPSHGDDFWASEARSLFVGLALYVLEKEDIPSTIGAIYRLLGTESDLGEVCRYIVKTHPELPIAGKKTLSSFANKATKERSGVKSNLDKALEQWDIPTVDAATSRSDFAITDLRKKKMAIYVGVRAGEINTLAPLLRVFFEQVITLLSMKEPDKTEPYKILMVMDEFNMLGKMSAMTSAFTLLSGYNCRVIAIVQGLGWLNDTYDRDKRDGILSCCAHQIFFAANDLETAKYVSESCGEKTIEMISTSQHQGSVSKNISHRTHPLITKVEVKQLPKDEQIILVENGKPVKAKKIQYFNDKKLKGRELPAPKIPELHFTDTSIPDFDLQPKEPDIDPNQGNMFDSENTCLTESLNEPSNDALEDDDVDENSYILKEG